MRGLRIILDKSAVCGLRNAEADSLDRYFFQIVPPILTNEILADLAKDGDPKAASRIAANTYRVSGNQGLTLKYQKRLESSLLGSEIPMDGRFVASRETIVKTASGSLAMIIETPLEDEVLKRWESCRFTDDERVWAGRFRKRMERPLNTKLYIDNISKAGLTFIPPESEEQLTTSVNDLVTNRKLLPRLFALLAQDLGISSDIVTVATNRWFNEGKKPFEEFAPYAFYCLKASFLWHLSLTNPILFKPDRNDRKDLEYCFYLPQTQIFATRDLKQERLMSVMARVDQSVIKAEQLKADLKRLNDGWLKLSINERIALNSKRGTAPPGNEDGLVYQLWKKHDGRINPNTNWHVANLKAIDPTLPKDKQVVFTLSDFVRAKFKEVKEGQRLSKQEIELLNERFNGKDPTTILVFNSRITRERLRNWYPQLTETEVTDLEAEIRNQIYLDPSEYGHFVTV